MNFIYNTRPIIACSTGIQSCCALAIIRLSGFENIETLKRFFLCSGPIEPNYAYVTKVINPTDNEILDQIIMTYFKSPKSYTGENLLELSVHGNPLNIERIIKLFCDTGLFSLAHPGEFTYRALVNKKLTLSQVEGLDLLLNASSEFALTQGLQGLSGEIGKNFLFLREKFIEFRASFEIFIDFSEDVGEKEAKSQMIQAFRAALETSKVLALRCGHQDGLQTPKICLVGPSNSGKSTLFNAILGEKRSIVSEKEGTTRDYVSETLFYKGVFYKFLDTAGFRSQTSEAVEREGINRAKSMLKESFFKILVINPIEKIHIPEEKFLKNFHFNMLILTHADKKPHNDFLKNHMNSWNIKSSLRSGFDPRVGIKIFGPIEPFEFNDKGRELNGSIGPDIRDFMLESIHGKFTMLASKNPFLVKRQRLLIEKIHRNLLNLEQKLYSLKDVGILSSEIRIVENTISELVGMISPNEVIDSVFSNFCIGK